MNSAPGAGLYKKKKAENARTQGNVNVNVDPNRAIQIAKRIHCFLNQSDDLLLSLLCYYFFISFFISSGWNLASVSTI